MIRRLSKLSPKNVLGLGHDHGGMNDLDGNSDSHGHEHE